MRSMILGALLLTVNVAHAEMGMTFVIGSGQDSCSQLIAAVGNVPPGRFGMMNTANGVFVNEYKKYQEWLMGFVSGFNVTHATELEQQQVKIDMAGMDLWMRNWCNQHPTQGVFDGAIAFISEMRSNAAAAR